LVNFREEKLLRVIVTIYTRLFIELFSAAGTAILSKNKPLSVDKTLPGHPDPGSVKGRIITLEFEDYYVIGTYVVNAGQGLKVCSFTKSVRRSAYVFLQTLDAKKLWNHHFEAYIRDLDKKKPVIWAGDLNVAPTAIGSSHPSYSQALCDVLRPDQPEDKLEQVSWLHRS
jgi:exonuclease III